MKNSVIQRQRALVLESGRGEILDRNLQPLTGKIMKALVAFPINSEYAMNQQEVSQLARILQTNKESWISFTRNLKEPQVWGMQDGGKALPLKRCNK